MAATTAEPSLQKVPAAAFAIRFHHGVLQFSLPGPPNVALTEGCMSLLSDNSLGAEICNFDLRSPDLAIWLQYARRGSEPVAYFTGSVRKLHRRLHDWGSVGQARKFNWLKQTFGGNVRVI